MLLPAEAHGIETMPAVVDINGAELVLDSSGAAVITSARALLVADLHLEKGSSFARGGQLLPPYDTAATLARLARVAARHNPRAIVFMGDAFHDPYAGERIAAEAVAALTALGHGRDICWISGNHDPAPPASLPGTRLDRLAIGPLTLTHIPAPGAQPGEIAGHLHPVARVRTRAAVVRRACFLSDQSRLILPAFGAYTGGLNVLDPAFDGLFGTPCVHVLGERRVLPISLDKLV